MTNHQKNVKKFMEAAGQETPDTPCTPSAKIRFLRCKLLLEETIEAIQAMGFGLRINGEEITEENFNSVVDLFHQTDEVDVINLAKELADVSVVGPAGTACAFGIDIEPILDIVDENNLGKFGPGSYKNEYGKHCKPSNYPKPHERILKEINRQNSEALKKLQKSEEVTTVDHHPV